MPRRHCKTCGNPLHPDDTHAEYVSRLGISHTDTALSGADCSHCEHFSLASLRSWSAFFSESDSAPHALQFSFSQGSVRKNSGQRILAAGDKQAHIGSMPACLAVTAERERAFVHPLHSTWSASLRRERHDLVQCEWQRNRWQPFFLAASDTEVCSCSVTDPALLTSSSLRNARLRADEELICIMTKAVNELGLEWSPLRNHLAAGWTSVFSWGTIKPPRQGSSPFFPEVHM